MTERLINKGTNGEFWVSDTDYTRSKGKLPAVMEKLYKYETAEDEQRLLELPCKIGDVVYVIDEAECLSIRKTTIEGITINERGICFMIPTKKANMSFGYYNSDFDKAVFFSIEEAEKALKEMKK